MSWRSMRITLADADSVAQTTRVGRRGIVSSDSRYGRPGGRAAAEVTFASNAESLDRRRTGAVMIGRDETASVLWRRVDRRATVENRFKKTACGA
jgi:hypothetical protein